MYRSILAIFFSLFFMSLISAPTIIVTIDKSIDVSMFYALCEEEEEKESENSKEFELVTFELSETNFLLFFQSEIVNSIYGESYDSNPFLNLDSPPPKYLG